MSGTCTIFFVTMQLDKNVDKGKLYTIIVYGRSIIGSEIISDKEPESPESDSENLFCHNNGDS